MGQTKFLIALALSSLVGCYTNVGPVITDVRLDNGALRYTRCDLEVSGWWGWGGGDLDHCVNEVGKKVSPPESK